MGVRGRLPNARFRAGAALLIGLAASAAADVDPPRPTGLFVGYGFGRNELLFGAEDPRVVRGVFLEYARPEDRLRLGRNRAQLVLSLYSAPSERVTYGHRAPSRTDSVGLVALARWRWRSGAHFPLYGELGWGLYYAAPRTHDLPATLNSTPTFGIGVRIIDREELGMVGLRLIHASNAGFVGANGGQNLLFLVGTAHVRT